MTVDEISNNSDSGLEHVIKAENLSRNTELVLEGEKGAVEGILVRLMGVLPLDRYRLELQGMNIVAKKNGYNRLNRGNTLKSIVDTVVSWWSGEEQVYEQPADPLVAVRGEDSYRVTLNEDELGYELANKVRETLERQPTIEDLFGHEEEFQRSYTRFDEGETHNSNGNWIKVKEAMGKATDYQKAVFLDIARSVDRHTGLSWAGENIHDLYKRRHMSLHDESFDDREVRNGNSIVLGAARLLNKGYDFDQVMDDLTNNHAIMRTYLHKLRKSSYN